MDIRTGAGGTDEGWRSERPGSPGPTALLERGGDGDGIDRRALARAERRARGLGWFSVGLGAAQLLAPVALARLIGIGGGRGARQVMLAVGLREVVAGAGIITRRRPARWLWTRVLGDIVDLALLASARRAQRRTRARVSAALAAVAGVTVLDIVTSRQLGRAASAERRRPLRLGRAITVNRAPEEVYRFWRNLQNLPRFMAALATVEVRDERRSHWCARSPRNKTVEWDAEIVEDRPGEILAWRTLEPSDVSHAGAVHFLRAPGGRGTEVQVEIEYRPPAGRLGATVAKLVGRAPAQAIERDLRRLKQVLETGEVVHSDASIHRGRHPARPSARPSTEGEDR